MDQPTEIPTSIFQRTYKDIVLTIEGDDQSKIYTANKNGQQWFVKCKNVTK